jgi:hypothetical protein
MLIERRYHRLRNIREEVIDAEAGTGERVHPVVLQQAADNESQQEVGEIAGPNRMGVETQRHPRRVPVDDHADEREE